MDVGGGSGKPKRVKVTIWDTGNRKEQHTYFTYSYLSWARKVQDFNQFLLSWCTGNYFRYIVFSFAPYTSNYRNSVYDVARKETFDSLGMWLQEVEQFSMGGGKEVVKLLVGNKVDQPRVVKREDAGDWAQTRGMLFMEASAKTKEGISQVFNEVVQKVKLLICGLHV